MCSTSARPSRPVPAQWVQQALSVPGIQLTEFTPDIALESTRLPSEVHSDPADRMLIASARHHDAHVVTRDRGILACAEAGHVKAIDATP